jgi:poly-gamma-glutamate synthesis protein (capsule biosynthesis protein)
VGATAAGAGGSPTAIPWRSTDDAVGVSPGAGAVATTPTETTAPPPPKQDLVIHATGDVSLDPDYIPAFRTNGYDWAWTGLGGLFRRDDLTIINHECPSTEIVAPIPKEFSFRCDPAALPVAKRFGVDVANLANNHGIDQGPEGLLDSIRNLRRAGIVPVGAGASQREADAPAYVEVNGWSIGIVGAGEVLGSPDWVAVGDRPGIAVGHDFGRALRAIRIADAHEDIVLVVIHWGVELDTQPRDYQIDEARRMIAAGADAIFGHHAHRLQPMDMIRGRPVFYGLGNFVWPNLSVAGSTTAVAEVTVSAEGRIRGRLLPAFIEASGHPVLR